jgi:hypothetical protein
MALITSLKSKKKQKENKKERTYLSVRSGTVRSASSVRTGSIPKKKEKRALIRFPKVKKTKFTLYNLPFIIHKSRKAFPKEK